MRVVKIDGPKRRVLDLLKRSDGLGTRDLAEALSVSDVAVRRHLSDLTDAGLVAGRAGEAQGRGRPPTVWSLTDLSRDLFPDHHDDLTVELIDAIRRSLGEDGLDRVLAVRADDQVVRIRSRFEPGAPVEERVRALADRRTEEGYMAEVSEDTDGSLLLLEHHCPVCAAATECQGICRYELETFQRALGDDVRVERTDHLLSGDARCTYRITPRARERPEVTP